MTDSTMYMLMGAVGILALLAFIQKPEPTPTAAPPSPEVQRRIWEQIEAPPAPTPVPTAPGQTTNMCGSARFAYPDFSGTPRAGQKCADDIDCQNHPPVGFPHYDQCCRADGTCFTWI